MVALVGSSTVCPLLIWLSPLHKLDEIPSLSSFQLPSGRGTVFSCPVGL